MLKRLFLLKAVLINSNSNTNVNSNANITININGRGADMAMACNFREGVCVGYNISCPNSFGGNSVISYVCAADNA